VTVWIIVDDFGAGDFSGWVSECIEAGHAAYNNETSLQNVGCP